MYAYISLYINMYIYIYIYTLFPWIPLRGFEVPSVSLELLLGPFWEPWAYLGSLDKLRRFLGFHPNAN